MTGIASKLVARRRIRNAFIAQLLARIVRVAEQLFLIPLFLSSWSVQFYGEWLALTAVAAFAGIANFGIAHAAASEIVLRASRTEFAMASRVLVTSLTATIITILLGIIAMNLILAFADLRMLTGLKTIEVSTPKLIVLLLALSMLLNFLSEPIAGALSAARGAALSNTIAAASKVAELISIAIALKEGAGPLAVASIMVAGAALNITLQMMWAIRCVSWLSLSPANFDFQIVRHLWRPSAGSFVIYVCLNIFYVYLPRLVVVRNLGPVALATYSVLMTYTRVGRNLATMASQATRVEIGRSWASGDGAGTRQMIFTMLRNAMLSGAILLLGELVVAPWAIARWTSGSISLDWSLLLALALVALLGCYFDGLEILASALNRVGWISAGYTAGLALAIGSATLLLPWTGQLATMGICLLLPEIGGIIGGQRTLRRVMTENL